MPTRINIKDVPWDDRVAADLRAAQRAELDFRFGHPDHEAGPPPSAADAEAFVIAYERTSGLPLGCGGLRRLDGSSAEIKRVYVIPYARGSGVSAGILAALEERARAAGFTSLLAETGAAQPEARRLYEREGYELIPNFGPYEGVPASQCYAKRLAVRVPASGW